jgi:hypothetical protein
MKIKLVLSALLGLSIALTACTTTPTANQQIAVTVVVDAAVGIAVQNGTNDAREWSQRASRIVSIATQLQALDSGQTATLPAVVSALQPLLVKAKLGPADQLAANALIVALSQIIQQNVNNINVNTQQVIQQILSDVINAASVYVAPGV